MFPVTPLVPIKFNKQSPCWAQIVMVLATAYLSLRQFFSKDDELMTLTKTNARKLVQFISFRF